MLTIDSRKARRTGRNFAQASAGNVGVMFGLAFVPLALMAGAAIDFGQTAATRSRLQHAVDEAALLVASQQDLTQAQRQTMAQNSVLAYLGTSASRYSVTASSITETEPAANLYTVSARASVPTTLMRLMNTTSVQIGANATATLSTSGVSSPACVLALDPSSTPNVTGIVGAGAGGLNASGSGTVNLVGCNIYVNSASGLSIDVTGGGSISADNVTTAGRYSGNVVATKGAASAPTTNAPVTPDPYASRFIPAPGACLGPTSWSGNIANPSGVLTICGDVAVTGATTLSPGVYIIRDGSLTSSKPITGSGVTIILTSNLPSTDNGVFDFKAGATLTLTAPTSGPSAGIVLWADARLPHNADNFRAGTTGNITGAVYLPSHLVNYSGSATAGSICTQLIAAEIAISGGASFQHQCSGVGVADPVSSNRSVARLSQ